ncbi:MAG: prolyl-tRNA synthetase associated domain-containing protein [Syntrophomonadaceae bacterium]
MDNPQEKVLKKLDAMRIEYQLVHHSAAFTVEDMDELNLSEYGEGCVNLFLRDDKGKRHFLVVMFIHKRADFKSIQKQLGCSRLGFASEERLYRFLKLHKGEVTPLGIINDHDGVVEMVLDRELIGQKRLGFHPNDNTATVWISFDDLVRIIEQNGNKIHFVDV